MSLSIACLPQSHEARRLFLDDLGKDLGDGQRLDVLMDVIGGHDKDRAVCAHRQRGAQRLLRLLHADRNGDDLVGLAGLLQAEWPLRRRFRRRGSSTS